MPDIFDTIRADHDRHRALLARIADTSGASSERRDAWRTFYREVKSHAAAEEETFYARLMTRTWGQDHARHSVHEHQELDDLLEELNGADMASSGWLRKFETLRHDYEHHIDEEERDIFPRAREVIPADEIAGAERLFVTRKNAERDLIDDKVRDSLED